MKKFLFEKDDIKKSAAAVIILLAVAFRLVLSYRQYVTIYPPLAPLDDDLMFRAAQSIVSGNWLGEYGYLTISKHMFFALWLAFLHVVKVPYLVGNMALWAAACGVAAAAFAPVLKRRWASLVLFLFLLYNPAASARYATRIYRDAIFPALCLMFFSAVAAVGLRSRLPVKKWRRWAVLYGASYGCIYLRREDGIWVLPFGAVALVITAGLLVSRQGVRTAAVKTAAMLAPAAIGALIIGGYCYMNWQYYGRFIVSDFTSREFKSAYGALTSLEQDNWHPMVAVPEDVRQDVYRAVEMFAPVEQALEEPLLVNGYKNEAIGDFPSGAFYWALRQALSSLGVYDSPQKAQDYYTQLTRQIQQAVDSGRLKTQNGSTKLRKSTTPPIKARYVPRVLEETLAGFKVCMFFEQCDPLAERAVGRTDEIQPVEQFVHQNGATALIPYTEIPYLSPVRSVGHTFLRAVNIIYKIFIPIAFVSSVMWQIKRLRQAPADKKFTSEDMLNIILLGFIGMALLRCAMIAFMEVSSFGIGTYVMYLSTVHPLLIAYSVLGLVKNFEY